MDGSAKGKSLVHNYSHEWVGPTHVSRLCTCCAQPVVQITNPKCKREMIEKLLRHNLCTYTRHKRGPLVSGVSAQVV
jgi:hypothetical protein